MRGDGRIAPRARPKNENLNCTTTGCCAVIPVRPHLVGKGRENMTKLNPKSVSVNEASRWFGLWRQILTEWLNALGIDYSEGVSVPDIFKAMTEHE